MTPLPHSYRRRLPGVPTEASPLHRWWDLDVVEHCCPCQQRPQGEKLFHPLSPAWGNVDMHTRGMWVSRTQRLIPIQGRPLIEDTHNVCVCVSKRCCEWMVNICKDCHPFVVRRSANFILLSLWQKEFHLVLVFQERMHIVPPTWLPKGERILQV